MVFSHASRGEDGQLVLSVLADNINTTWLLRRLGARWIDVVARDLEIMDQNASFETMYQKDKLRERACDSCDGLEWIVKLITTENKMTIFYL